MPLRKDDRTDKDTREEREVRFAVSLNLAKNSNRRIIDTTSDTDLQRRVRWRRFLGFCVRNGRKPSSYSQKALTVVFGNGATVEFQRSRL